MQRNRSAPVIFIGAAVLFILCYFSLAVGAGIWSLVSTQAHSVEASPSPVVVRPMLLNTPVAPYTDTLNTLENTIVPDNNLIELAERLQGVQNIPTSLPGPAQPLQMGQVTSFWVSNTDTNQSSQVQATLHYVTPHVYFWVENGVTFNQNELERLADTFENKIYPTDRAFFGSEWTPGVDDDPHLYILYTRGLGSSIAGYFSSADEYPPAAHKYSNAHEMFMLSADNVDLGEKFAYGVLAHEFQHMIHWYRDRNEETWMNEGFSDLAMFLNGYNVGGVDLLYTRQPDLQLNDWPTDPKNTGPHYGAAFLFLTYFLDRFGEDATKALVAEPSNGMVSIDQLLAEKGITNPRTGKPMTADDVFADWVLASYLQDPQPDGGIFTYHNYPQAPKPKDTQVVRSCPAGPITSQVDQYGVDYIRLSCSGDYNLHFEGSTQAQLLPEDPHSGSYALWSNKGDESDMTLTRSFDFRQVSAPLSLSYWTWYDIEKDYDYVYLEASLDGEHWTILKTPSGTAEDPSGNSYGWGYNGNSGGGSQAQWIQEQVDLSQFAGKQVQLRFEYITDAAVNGEGFLLDDVAIPKIGYSSNFEGDNGGWQGDGFVRIQNVLPQTFRLSIIYQGRSMKVEEYSLSALDSLDVPLSFGKDYRQVILVVSGTTRFTRQPAAYRFSLQAAK